MNMSLSRAEAEIVSQDGTIRHSISDVSVFYRGGLFGRNVYAVIALPRTERTVICVDSESAKILAQHVEAVPVIKWDSLSKAKDAFLKISLDGREVFANRRGIFGNLFPKMSFITLPNGRSCDKKNMQKFRPVGAKKCRWFSCLRRG